MRLSNQLIFPIILVIFFGGIFISNTLGLWQTESTKEPQLITSGEYEGMPNPEDIRGSYSFQDIQEAFNIDPKILAQAFGLPLENAQDILAKDLEEIYTGFEGDIEIGTGSIRFFVALYTSLPYTIESYLLTNAKDILVQEGKWNDELELSLTNYIISLDDQEVVNTEITEEDTLDHEDVIAVTGKTTVTDLLSWGMSREDIDSILSVTYANDNLLIRDICEDSGLSFSEIKVKLNDKLEEIINNQ